MYSSTEKEGKKFSSLQQGNVVVELRGLVVRMQEDLFNANIQGFRFVGDR